MAVRRVALLTAGGFAPCLSAAVGGLIQRYTEVAPEVEIIAYRYGYQGLLSGDSIVIGDEVRAGADVLHRFGGSPDRQLPGQADERQGPGQARPGDGRPGSAPGGRRPADRGRRRHPAHHRRGRHQHHRRGPRGVPRPRGASAGGRRPAEDHRQRRDTDQADAWGGHGRRTGRDLRPEHRGRAQLRLPHADRARGDGPSLRLADGRHRQGLPGLAGHPDVAAGDRAVPGGVGRARGVCPGARRGHRGGGRQAAPGDGHVGQRDDLPVRGSGYDGDRRTVGGGRRGRGPRRLRPCPARRDQSGRLVRQAVRRQARCREGNGAEVRLLRPVRRGQRRGPRADPQR